jgi:hypothetical protein
MDYPYLTFTGHADVDQSDQLAQVVVRVDDEYHLLDEQALIDAVRGHMAGSEGISSVTVTRSAVAVTDL